MGPAEGQPLPDNHPRVYAVVVKWNRPSDTLACLRSLAALEGLTPRLVVVDNGSTDNSVAQIEGAFPTAELLRSEENIGYGPGANLGIQFALAEKADYIFLLNNDAVVDPQTLVHLLAEKRENIEILAPMIYYAAPSTRIWSIGGDTHSWTLEKSSPRRNTEDRGGWPETIQRDFFPGPLYSFPGTSLKRSDFLTNDFACITMMPTFVSGFAVPG